MACARKDAMRHDLDGRAVEPVSESTTRERWRPFRGDDVGPQLRERSERLLLSCLLQRQLTLAKGHHESELPHFQGLACALEFEQERSRELRNRGDYWQVVANGAPPAWATCRA